MFGKGKGILGFWSHDLNHDKIFEEPVERIPVGGKSTDDLREEPATINLYRAVLDESPKILAKIERELQDLDRKQHALIRQREIYGDLLLAAKKHSEEAK